MKNILLSVAIATYNEEKNIVDCLGSVDGLADEVVVVDGNSNDNTADLATRTGARVVETKNQKMFHINKNLAIDNCRGKWILLLDADERISAGLKKEIKEVIKSKPAQNGFWVKRKNWFLGDFLTKGGAYPDPVIRLFKKGKGHLPERSVHEQVKIDGLVGYLENEIVHIADPDFSRYLQRANRYTDLTAAELSAKKIGKNPTNTILFMIIKPLITFFDIYIRHAGFKDGFRGFAWAIFSASHHFLAYSKYFTSKS